MSRDWESLSLETGHGPEPPDPEPQLIGTQIQEIPLKNKIKCFYGENGQKLDQVGDVWSLHPWRLHAILSQLFKVKPG